MKKILVIAAHPDDEVLGCGGTIVKLVNRGCEVYALVLGEGITSRDRKRNIKKRSKEIKELKLQMHKASKILGVKKIFSCDFPDNRFDKIPILCIIKEIERVKSIIRPSVIYTHHYGDLNIDHHIVYKAVITACRPLKKEAVTEIFSFEIPSSTEWYGPDRRNYFAADKFVDISNELVDKIKAIRCYKNELRAYPHPRSVKGVRILAEKRGLEAGLRYAEAFETVRVIVR